jgi:metal-sulfur cluster biosynthetic enzyme
MNTMVVDIWDLGKTDRGLAETLHIALQSVMDPELGMNIVQLGLVRNVKIEDGEALVTMILTTPFCPYAPQIMEECRSKTEEVLGIPTKIEMGREVWDRSMMEEDAIDWGLY